MQGINIAPIYAARLGWTGAGLVDRPTERNGFLLKGERVLSCGHRGLEVRSYRVRQTAADRERASERVSDSIER